MGQSSRDVRAGGAFYELVGLDKLSPVLDRLKKRAAEFASFMGRVGKASALAGGALTAPLTALFKGGSDRAADLARLERQLGVPIEVLNKLQYAADAAGVSLEEVMQDRQGRFSDLIARAPAINPNDARAAAQAQLELSDATRSVQLALLPLVQILVIYVKKLSEWVKNNAASARTVLAVGVGLVALAAIIKIVAISYGVLKAVALTTYSVMGAPFLIGATAGAAFVAVILWATGKLQGFADFLGNGFANAAEVAAKAWGGISDALQKGDLTLAGQIALKGLEVAWLDLVDTLTMAWTGFKGVFVDGWKTAVAGVEIVWEEFRGWLTKGMNSLFDGILAKAAAVARAAGQNKLAGDIEDARGFLKGADAIDAETEARKDAIVAELDADLKERADKRLKDMMDAKAALAKAKGELDDLNALAAEPAAPAGELDKKLVLKQGLLGGVEVKGSFSGAAIGQQLGIGNEAQKQTELLKNMLDGNGNLPAAIGIATGKNIAELFKVK